MTLKILLYTSMEKIRHEQVKCNWVVHTFNLLYLCIVFNTIVRDVNHVFFYIAAEYTFERAHS